MKLTIITVSRNNAAGLERTIKSVLCQTFQDFEYLVIDGDSADDSVDVIRHFEALSSIPFVWLSEPDSGIYEAMNKGIRRAKGEYLLFMNSGDLIVDRQVLQQVFDMNPTADVVCARCNVVDKGKAIWTSDPPEAITFGTLYREGLAHQSTFIKRDLFSKSGLYREDFRYLGDQEFWFRTIIGHHAAIEKSDVVVCHYNLNGISSLENQTGRYREERAGILAPYDRFTPDYDAWEQTLRSMHVLLWVKSKFCLYKPLCWIYSLAGSYVAIKRSLKRGR